MQTSECDYCGAILDHSIHQCVNCGGQVKRVILATPKRLNKNIIVACLSFFVIAISTFTYYKSQINHARALVNKSQTASLPNSQPTRVEPVIVPNVSTLNANPFVIQAKFAQALSNITPIKILVIEFHLAQGRYPGSLHELGFNEQSFDTGELIQAIKLSETGSIRSELAPKIFGDKKYFALKPTEFMGGMNIEWACTTNMDRHLIAQYCNPIT